jgi:acyl-CoA synthetase (AMP-forming)/AMP-acid ligase II
MLSFFSGFDACPERVAFDFGDSQLTYGVLQAAARGYAERLQAAGVGAGDRVAYFGPSEPALVVVLLAHLRMGVIHVPINTRYKAQEIRHILTDSRATLLVAQPDSIAAQTAQTLAAEGHIIRTWAQPVSQRSALADWPASPPAPDATALLIYTSGTTGQSKGVVLSHRGLTENVGSTTSLWEWSASDRLALALPLFHVHGLGLGVLGTLLNQMTARVFKRFEPASIVAAFIEGATIFMGVPTMYHGLIAWLDAHPADAEHLGGARLFTSGSAALPASDHVRFEALTGHVILERYGMSETGFTLSNPYRGERRPGTVGFAVPGYEVKVVDEDGRVCEPGQTGEIRVRGNGMMREYWRQPAVTAAQFDGGWFRTGDVATVDPDGYHRIVGRSSVDIIKSGGFKISAREIEDVLLTDPAIAEVAVVGVADPQWGERIVAAIVLSAQASFTDENALLVAAASRVEASLAAYKKPRAVRVLDALPRNALGKVQKHRLRVLFAT